MSERDVLKKLLEDHVGRQNAITQSQLGEALGLNRSTLRSELRRLREERKIPIGNLRDGYFIIRDREELQEYIGHINSEIQSKKNTIEHTLQAFDEFDAEIEADGGHEILEQSFPCAKCGKSVPRSDVKYAQRGEFADQPLCPHDYGKLVMEGEA